MVTVLTVDELGILDTVEERLDWVEAQIKQTADGNVRLDLMQNQITAEVEQRVTLETVVLELSQVVRQMARTLRCMGDLAVEAPMAPDLDPC